MSALTLVLSPQLLELSLGVLLFRLSYADIKMATVSWALCYVTGYGTSLFDAGTLHAVHVSVLLLWQELSHTQVEEG